MGVTYPFSDMDVSVLDILAAHTGSALRKAQMIVEMVRFLWLCQCA